MADQPTNAHDASHGGLLVNLMQVAFTRLALEFAKTNANAAITALQSIEVATPPDAARLAGQQAPTIEIEALSVISNQVCGMVARAREGIAVQGQPVDRQTAFRWS